MFLGLRGRVLQQASQGAFGWGDFWSCSVVLSAPRLEGLPGQEGSPRPPRRRQADGCARRAQAARVPRRRLHQNPVGSLGLIPFPKL